AAAPLRPLGRSRAGQPASGVRVRAGGRVLAGAGEEIFGPDPSTGRVLWKRILGAEAGPITGEATLGIVAGGRVFAVDPLDGVPQGSVRGHFRSVAPPAALTAAGSSTTAWPPDDRAGDL